MSKANGHNERTISGRDTGPQLTIYNEIKEAGFDKGDTVNVTHGNGYLVITPTDADVPISEVGVEDRPNVSDTPVESPLEARMVGNRLWELGEKYQNSGFDHVAEETQELSRRFHKYANNHGGDNE